jgi:nucleoid DNA-binding protein
MGKITIQEIAKILVEKNHIESQAASQFVNEMFAIILDRLSQGEAVKVKGLGTFKIIDVEARESVSVRTGERVVIDGHSKVTFTPDTTMKELVNKPFSHFETVMLNEGVEFEDMKEPEPPTPEQQEPVAEEPVVEESVAEEPVVEEPVVEQPVAEEPVAEEPVVEQPEPAEEPAVVQPPIMPAFHKQTHEEPKEEEMENKKKKSIWPSILKCLLVLALMAASAYIGYYYGSNKPLPDVVPDTIVVRDTVDLQAVKKNSESKINSAKQEAEEKAKQEAAAKAQQEAEEKAKQEAAAKAKQEAEEKAKQQAAEAAKAKAKAEEKKAAQSAAIADKYAAKDARVRLGAYRIVGLDHEVKVQAGQTFYSICKANLGPDMECYVEVYNDLPSRPTLKEGQIIKIPKLELKKKRKQ